MTNNVALYFPVVLILIAHCSLLLHTHCSLLATRCLFAVLSEQQSCHKIIRNQYKHHRQHHSACCCPPYTLCAALSIKPLITTDRRYNDTKNARFKQTAVDII